ncbi:MFS transporter [Herbiconiux sp. UC225_62]|uniref:MFS transporter n=1 Tax=Herbiconiux sp. UC225_62 TaxID=3350168 RepID=UPI0036D342DB
MEQARPTFPLVPLLAVCAGYFMVILDVTVINVAVPQIGAELSASLTGIQWITDGYTIVFAGALLAGGALGDRVGNRRIFSIGVVVFTVASIGCAVAWTTEVLIALRLLEGLGAALIVPGSLALLQQTYASPDHRARAFGLWGGIAGAAACAGPIVGGLLTGTVGWRWVFLINVPIGIACLILTATRVGASARRPGRSIDWPAQAAVVAAIVLVVGALNEAGEQGWTSPLVLTAFAIAAVAVGAFVLRERFAASPVLPLSMLRTPAIAGAATIGLLFNLAFYSMIFTASLSFQHEEGFGPVVTGVALLPAMITTVFASVLSGRLARRTGHRTLMTIGLLIGASGLTAWAALEPHPEYWLLVVPMMAAGFGTSFTLTGATTTIMSAAPEEFSGTASALFNTARQIGSAAGVALSGSLLVSLDFDVGLRISMVIGATAFLAGAVLTRLTIPAPAEPALSVSSR